MAKQQNIDNEDWRLQGVTTIMNVPDNTRLKSRPGDIVKVVIVPRQFGGDIVVDLPNSTALFLDLAQNAQSQADDLRKEAFQQRDGNYLDNKRIFAYFQKMMSSIVFAFVALESFANEEIPDMYQHIKKRKSCFYRSANTLLNANLVWKRNLVTFFLMR